MTKAYGEKESAQYLYEHAKSFIRIDNQKSLELAFQSLEFAESSQEFHYELKSLFLIAWLNDRLDNISESLNYYFEILKKQPELKKNEDKKILLSAYRNLSLIISQYEEFSKN